MFFIISVITMKWKGKFVKDLMKKQVKELVKERSSIMSELFDFRMKNNVKGLKETHKISKLKKNLARINTVLNIKINDGSNR